MTLLAWRSLFPPDASAVSFRAVAGPSGETVFSLSITTSSSVFTLRRRPSLARAFLLNRFLKFPDPAVDIVDIDVLRELLLLLDELELFIRCKIPGWVCWSMTC